MIAKTDVKLLKKQKSLEKDPAKQTYRYKAILQLFQAHFSKKQTTEFFNVSQQQKQKQ